MKYIFFGTPRFAEIILDELLRADMPPVALVCNPDRPIGRKKIITPPATKLLAEKYQPHGSMEIFQPEKIDASFLEKLVALEPDFFVVAAYAKILPKSLLDIPRLGTLGVHPSLLPKYRGASPIQSAILGGDGANTGTTIYLMDEKADHGPILAQEKLSMQIEASDGNRGQSELPYLEIEEQLAKLSAKLLINIIPNFTAQKINPEPQNESQATFTKKFTTQDGFIDDKNLIEAKAGNPEKAVEILRKINALNPEPGTWILQNGKRIKLLKATLQNNKLVLLLTQQEGEKPKGCGS